MNAAMIRKALFFAVILFAFSCKKKFDEFYERPSTLEPPVYQQLQSRGNFTKFLSLVDKAGYTQTLSSAGYWTVLAPTDSAFAADVDFQAYLSAKGISSVDKIDNATAQAIVQYLLIYNGFNQDRIDDYQSNTGWIENQAFKRRTAYYSLYYNDTTAAGQALIAVGSNRNNNGLTNSYYNSSDNNNKHIPYFTTDFLTAKGLSSSDYNAFFPNTAFKGFNIANAIVTQKNIAAENGVIHIIDRVITPIMNLEEYLKSKPEYSEFRNILNKYMVQFVQNPDATHRYQVVTGKSDNVFIKVYSNLLAFSPNNENYAKLQDNDAQQNGWTMMVPKNDSLKAYVDRIAAEGYGKIDNFPISVIADLINRCGRAQVIE